MGGLEQGWGLDVILWFQSWRTPLMEAYGRSFDFFGSEDFFLILMPIIYWCINSRLGSRLILLLVFSVWANSWMKLWFRRPRPFEVSPEVNNLVEEVTYGFPSADVQNSTIIGGVLALHMRRAWFAALTVLYVLLIFVGRMVAGVHYPQDVVGGLILGLVTLALYAWLEPQLSTWLARRSLWEQIAVVLGAAAVMLIIHPGLIPAESAADVEGAGSALGVWIGGGIGLALEVRSVRFDAGGVWWKRIVRLVLGFAGLLALRFGLGAAFEGLEPEFAFRILRYSVIGLWAAFGAPWVFLKAGLAGRRSEM